MVVLEDRDPVGSLAQASRWCWVLPGQTVLSRFGLIHASADVCRECSDVLLLCVLSPVFICSYMFLAPVFGYLGDRYNRKLIMSAGIAFWSVVTLASSYTPGAVSVCSSLCVCSCECL